MKESLEPMRLKAILLFIVVMTGSASVLSAECVILLHGLARTANSMNELAEKLGEAGYYVANIDYPSREKPVEELAALAIDAGLEQCAQADANTVNFVAHSLGGILIRYYYRQHDPELVRRVVMLGPPNRGSEVVDELKDFPGFAWLNGPAGRQLGTDENSIPNTLGPVNFELGVIAGTQSINLILSQFLPNPDDGKVSVERAKVDGMCGFVALPTTHPFMMSNNRVIAEVIYFLAHGRFNSEQALSVDCEHSGPR